MKVLSDLTRSACCAILAIAPVAGVAPLADCMPSRAVPVRAFHGTDDQTRRKRLLWVSCAVNLGILAVFKSSFAGRQLPCIRCGDCAAVCPVQLLPQQLFWYACADNEAKMRSHGLTDCIECGCCSYVCPSNIPLVQYYRASKATFKALSRLF